MSERDDGGPAFPTVASLTTDGYGRMVGISASAGLSVRDYFAGMALQGYVASFAPNNEPAEYASKIAKDCYALAAAMLKERAK